jgi:hypothetical protein
MQACDGALVVSIVEAGALALPPTSQHTLAAKPSMPG